MDPVGDISKSVQKCKCRKFLHRTLGLIFAKANSNILFLLKKKLIYYRVTCEAQVDFSNGIVMRCSEITLISLIKGVTDGDVAKDRN